MNSTHRQSGARYGWMALLLVGALGGCDGLLDVKNPTLVTPGDVEGKEEMLAPFVAGIEAQFRRGYAWMASSGAAASDEAVFGHVWTPWNEYDRRKVTPEGIAGLGYGFVAAAITAGELYSGEIERLVGAGAERSPALAGALAYTGFGYILGADHHCRLPVDGVAVSVEQAYRRAIERLERAATIAGRAAAEASSSDERTRALHWQNLAHLGIARAHLQLGERTRAIEFAQRVDPAWPGAWVRYSPDNDFGNWTFYNLFARTAGFKSPVEFNQGIGPQQAERLRLRRVPGTDRFTWDRRVPFQADSVTLLMGGWNAPRYAYIPFSPASFSGHNPSSPAVIGEDEDIRFASALEAKYIIAEASLNGGTGGWTEAQVRGFIDERRAAGGLEPFAGGDLFRELRLQKLLDFYFAGFRFPDLRRYREQYGIDEFPSGPMDGFLAGPAPEQYGTDVCWPLPPLDA